MANDTISSSDRKAQRPIPSTLTESSSSSLSSVKMDFINSPKQQSQSTIGVNRPSQISKTSNLDELFKSVPTDRPLSSSLNKYSALPKIGTKLSLNEEILIGLRLPDGSKLEHRFQTKSKLQSVLTYALSQMKDSPSNTEYVLLQMPNKLIDDLQKPIEFYQIKDRSMLFVIDKKATLLTDD